MTSTWAPRYTYTAATFQRPATGTRWISSSPESGGCTRIPTSSRPPRCGTTTTPTTWRPNTSIAGSPASTSCGIGTRSGCPCPMAATTCPSCYETRTVLRFDVVRPARDHSSVPELLRPAATLPDASVVRDVTLSLDLALGKMVIDGKPFDPARVDATIRRGSTETWRITNLDTRF